MMQDSPEVYGTGANSSYDDNSYAVGRYGRATLVASINSRNS